MNLTIFCEKYALAEEMEKYLSNYSELKVIVCFENEKFFSSLKENHADIFLLEIHNNDSLEKMIDAIRKYQSEAVIALIGNSESDAAISYHYRCDGIMLEENMFSDIDPLIKKMMYLANRITKVKILTFGRFRVYVGGKPLQFSSEKARELLALCVDRNGADVSIYEIIDTLWPHHTYDKNVKCLCRKAIMNLKITLSAAGVEYIFARKRGFCRIVADLVECDYFSFMENPEKYSSSFPCNYLLEYSWAERTISHFQPLYPSDTD